MVFTNRQDLIGRNTGRILCIVTVYGKICAVKFIQSIVGSYPHQTGAVLPDHTNRIGRQSLFGCQGREIEIMLR
jgi:hypothetical protein